MLEILKRLRERAIGPIVHRMGEIEANHTKYLASHLDGIEANLLRRIADSEKTTSTLIERTRQEMRGRSEMQLRALVFEGTCINTLKAETADGAFSFDARDDIVGWTIAKGFWEPNETAWIKTILRPGDFAIDVGANLGWYTVIMGRLVGQDGTVAAFEPEPRNFELLNRNVTENQVGDNCKLFQMALLDHAGDCRMEVSNNNFGDHRVRHFSPDEFMHSRYDEKTRREIAVRADTLDAALDLADLINRKVRLLKIDAQGSEISIMRGGRRTLDKTEYMIIEYWPYGLERAGGSADDFYSCARDHFIEFSRFSPGRQVFRPIGELRDDLSIPADSPAGETVYILRK